MSNGRINSVLVSINENDGLCDGGRSIALCPIIAVDKPTKIQTIDVTQPPVDRFKHVVPSTWHARRYRIAATVYLLA
jgi:hypothetical protein